MTKKEAEKRRNEIFELYFQFVPQIEIAKKYGVTKQAVNFILLKHLPDEIIRFHREIKKIMSAERQRNRIKLKADPEVARAKARQYIQAMRVDNPEKYQEFLRKSRIICKRHYDKIRNDPELRAAHNKRIRDYVNQKFRSDPEWVESYRAKKRAYSMRPSTKEKQRQWYRNRMEQIRKDPIKLAEYLAKQREKRRLYYREKLKKK
jgi:hypothetical protein